MRKKATTRRSTSSRSRATGRTTSSSRRVKTSRRTRAARVRTPLTLPVRPSFVLLGLAIILLVWQMAVTPAVPEAERFFSGSVAGMAAVLLIVGGVVLMGLEGAGLRQPTEPHGQKRSTRRVSSARRASATTRRQAVKSEMGGDGQDPE